MNPLVLLGLAAVVYVASKKKDQPAANKLAVDDFKPPVTDEVVVYKDTTQALAPVAETKPVVEPIEVIEPAPTPVAPPVAPPPPVQVPVKLKLYYGPYADKYDLDTQLMYLAEAYLDKAGGRVDDNYFKRQPPTGTAEAQIASIKPKILALQQQAADEIASDNVKAGYPLHGLAEYLVKADGAEISRLRGIAKTYYGKLRDLYTAIAQGQPLWPIFGRISFARATSEWNTEAVRAEYYANLLENYLASRTVIQQVQDLPSSDAPYIKEIVGIAPPPATIMPVGTVLNSPANPPLLSSFPAPTSLNPMPMMLWDVQKVAWVPQNSQSSISGTATIVDAMGKTIKVSAAFPYVAWIDNGIPKMQPNQVYDISNVVRLPDGRVVY